MVKGRILDDSFEQLVELGQSTVQQGVKQIKQTFSPLRMLEKVLGKDDIDNLNNKETKKPDNPHTPLDLEKLQKKYEDQDRAKAESLKNRLFQWWKNEEEKLLQRKKAEEQEKKRKEEQEKEIKKRKEEEQMAQQPIEIPRGKLRRSIFSPKKVAQRQQAEVKPSAGKQ